MDKAYIEENTRERTRLYRLTANLTDEELNLRLTNGWTVASALIHLAFWDQYHLAVLESWEQEELVSAPLTLTAAGFNVDAINSSIQRISLSTPPEMAIEIARDTADRIDRKLEAMTAEFAATIEQMGHQRILQRAMHRHHHLDQIDKAVGRMRTEEHGQ